MEIAVLSTRQRGAAYIDLVRDGQTILTRDVDLENGRAEMSVVVSPEMSGTLTIDAYVIGSTGRESADQRLVFVQPADELHIETIADARSYQPGAEAKVHFHVTNKKGEGVSAALGLEVVDQAVFALAEKQPGFAKVFFYLEQELMKPHYEIHSLSSTQVIESAQDESDESRDRAAKTLFAAAETVTVHTLESETGRAVPETAKADYMARYQDALVDYVRGLAANMTDLRSKQSVFPAFKELKDASGHAPRDAWGTELHIDAAPWRNANRLSYRVISAGPDRTFGTADDLTLWLEPKTALVSNRPQWSGWLSSENTITMRLQHGVGPENGLAEIAGVVMDVSGAVVPGARVQIQRAQDKNSRNTVADAAGNFSFSALPPGRYRVQVESAGFRSSIRVISLAARDRGVLSATLQISAVTETVQVEAGAVQLATMDAAMGATIGGPVRALPLNGRNFMQLAQVQGAKKTNEEASAKDESGSKSAPGAHVRSYFPEALYINPEIITDGERRRQHRDSAGRLDHHLAHGDAGFHDARRAGQRQRRASRSSRISSSTSICR